MTKPRLELLLQDGADPVARTTKRRIEPARKTDVTVGMRAVRVVVWRAADGMHVALAGEPVSAISIRAILFAEDPCVDLEAWLTTK